jgi:multicomponent Na+:H+ antiporter subunit C
MIGYRRGAMAPVFSDVLSTVRATDAVVQAVTLTDIVVGATVTALLLAFALRVYKMCGSVDPQELRQMRG